jgi:hypothetical protein
MVLIKHPNQASKHKAYLGRHELGTILGERHDSRCVYACRRNPSLSMDLGVGLRSTTWFNGLGNHRKESVLGLGRCDMSRLPEDQQWSNNSLHLMTM